LEDGYVFVQAQQLPAEVVIDAATEVHRGLCPVCGGSGPVDVHTSHGIWSIVVLSRWSSVPRISCRSCGVSRQTVGLLTSTLFGWWGFPWGLLMTPVQIVKNVVGLASPPNPTQPSDELMGQMRLVLAEKLVEDEEKAESPV
jgi:hypothetical protein